MKVLVRKLLRKTLGAPVLWFGLGGLAILAGLALSYHRAQIEADYAMAMRLGAPEAQPIELADPARPGEVNVIARFDTSQSVTVMIGQPGERVERVALPLFAVGDAATAEADLPTLQEAAGLLILQPSDLPALQETTGTTVFEGPLNGPSLPFELFGLDTAAVLAEVGIALPDQFVAVRPWLPSRSEALAPAADTGIARYLIWSGLALCAFGLGLSLRPDLEDEGRLLNISPPKIREKSVTRSRIMADTDRFNPLIGQDDIRRGAMERLHAAERAQGRTPSTFFTSGPASKVGGGWVKNRR